MAFRHLIHHLISRQSQRPLCADCRKQIQTSVFNHGDGRQLCYGCEVKRGQGEYVAHPEDFNQLLEGED